MPLTGQGTLGVGPADTMEGTDVWQACFGPRIDGSFRVQGFASFTGTIVGCGTGTHQWTIDGTISAPDPVTGNQTEEATARFFGTGTGGLANLTSGSFKVNSTITPQLTSSGVGRGSVVCGARR